MGRKYLVSQLMIALVAIVFLSGCETMKETMRETSKKVDLDPNYQKSMDLNKQYESQPALTSTRLGVPKSDGDVMPRTKMIKQETGFNTATIAYPTGRRDSSALLLTKTTPKIVRRGAAYQYTIEVTNLTDLDLQNVDVNEIIPEDFTLESVTPLESKKSGDNLAWSFPRLGPGETRAITLTGRATGSELPCCTSATYAAPALCADTGVVQPALDVSVSIPENSKTTLICDTIPVTYTVKNSGDSSLSGVMVKGNLPTGVTAAGGSSDVAFNAGGLNPGQSRTFTKMYKASKTGTYNFNATAADDSDIQAKSSVASAKVIEPSISVTTQAKKGKQYVGRDLAYSVTVRNTGSIAVKDAVVESSIPANARYKSSDNGGSASGNSVRWNTGSLAAGASKTYNFEATASSAGEATTNSTARAYCCSATDMAKAVVEGIPALLLEVVDISDPIEVGNQQTYEITVTNQGSADANNVRIDAQLEGMSYVSSTGPSTGSANGSDITIKAIPRIGAKDKKVWRVTAKATEAGDKRFKVQMNSAELGRPVEETESTFVY